MRTNLSSPSVFVLALLVAGCVTSRSLPGPPSPWLGVESVEVYRLLDPVRTPAGVPQGIDSFRGLPIYCSVTLSDEQVRALIAFHIRVEARIQYQASRGLLEGGTPGCVGFEIGVRVQEAGRTDDYFFCHACGWLFGADRLSRPGSDLLSTVYEDTEADWLNRFLSALLPCPPQGQCA